MRKLAVPTLAAIALMLCTTLPARPQAVHVQLNEATITAADGNEYSCDLGLVFTPSQISNWHCQAILTVGSPVEHAVKSEGSASAPIETPFGPGTINFPVDVEENPDGTANVRAHFMPPPQ